MKNKGVSPAVSLSAIAPLPVEFVSPSNNPEILNAEEVAALLGVDPSFIFEKTRSRCSNPLPSHSLGRYLRFFRHEVLAWISSQPSDRPKRKYRLSAGARKRLQDRNRKRRGCKAVAA
jgi:predicted DNA-binding transcriptional regulator AlpA